MSEPAAPQPLLVRLADVPPRQVAWLWPRRLPLAMPAVIFGEPGLGKTHAALCIVSTVSTGGQWPDGGRSPLGNVVVLSGEDDWATTLVPRLTYAGADLSRVFGFPGVAAFDDKGRRVFRLTVDADVLAEELQRVKATLLVVDPLTCFLGGVDSHVTSDVRAALTTLADVADHTGAAVVCVLHPNKNEHSGVSALNRLSGSGAFGAAARSVMAVVADPKDEAGERRLLLPVKCNVSAMPAGLGFRITSASPDTCDSAIAWDNEPVDLDADEAFGKRRPETPAMTAAKAFLCRVLGSGEPYPQKLIEEEAEHLGIKWATVRRAKNKLKVYSQQDRPGEPWYWTLEVES